MLVIGLTGGIASGKSTVSELFSDLGISVIDADIIARQLMQTGTPVFTEIVAYFGMGILDDNGAINRKKLANLVFSQEKQRRQLEAIVHPVTRQIMIDKIKQATGPYCIAAIPLLLEANMQDLVDRILVIDTPEDVQLKRLCTRDGLSESDARLILRAQLDRQQRLTQATDIIDNQGDINQLQSAIMDLHKKYIELAKFDG